MINAFKEVANKQEQIIFTQNALILTLEEEIRLLKIDKKTRSISGFVATNTDAKVSFINTSDNKKSILIRKIEDVIIDMVHNSDDRLKTNFSDYLSEKLNLDYTYLANIFSENQGITIEHCVISHKIQRVKSLIGHNELNLTEISWKLHYSSVAHLSTQFKKVTGMTPSRYKHLEHVSSVANV